MPPPKRKLAYFVWTVFDNIISVAASQIKFLKENHVFFFFHVFLTWFTYIFFPISGKCSFCVFYKCHLYLSFLQYIKRSKCKYIQSTKLFCIVKYQPYLLRIQNGTYLHFWLFSVIHLFDHGYSAFEYTKKGFGTYPSLPSVWKREGKSLTKVNTSKVHSVLLKMSQDLCLWEN